MIFINKINMTPRERALIEHAIAQEQKNAANIAYISMMVDLDLGDEDMEFADNMMEDEFVLMDDAAEEPVDEEPVDMEEPVEDDEWVSIGAEEADPANESEEE